MTANDFLELAKKIFRWARAQGGAGSRRRTAAMVLAVFALLVFVSLMNPLARTAIEFRVLRLGRRHAQNTVIGVMHFRGPSGSDNRFADMLAERLDATSDPFSQIEARRIPYSLAPHDSLQARVIGWCYGADLIIWGWYEVTEDSVWLSARLGSLGIASRAGIRPNERTIANARGAYSKGTLHSSIAAGLDGLARLTAARLCYQEGAYQASLLNYHRALASGILDAEPASRSRMLWEMGNALAVCGRTVEACDTLRSAVMADSLNAQAWATFAMVLGDLGESGRADGAYSRALHLANDRTLRGLIFQNRADFRLQHLGAVGPAKVDLDSAARLLPDNPVVHYKLAEVANAQGDSVAEFAELTASIEVFHAFWPAYLQRSFCEFERGHNTNGLADLSQAIEYRGRRLEDSALPGARVESLGGPSLDSLLVLRSMVLQAMSDPLGAVRDARLAAALGDSPSRRRLLQAAESTLARPTKSQTHPAHD